MSDLVSSKDQTLPPYVLKAFETLSVEIVREHVQFHREAVEFGSCIYNQAEIDRAFLLSLIDRAAPETEPSRPFSADPIILRGFAGYFHQCAAGAPPRLMTTGYAGTVAKTFDELADWLDRSAPKSNCDRRQEGIVALSDEIEKQLSVPPGPSPSSRPEPTTTGSPGGTEPQCSKCKTLLAFEGDECWACSKEER